MKILADENIEPFLVGWLRGQGHDVLSVRETDRGASDTDVLRMAAESDRVLLTADKDFGDLVFRQGRGAAGIILLRLRTVSRQEYLHFVQQHFAAMERAAPGHFVTATSRALRVRPLLPRDEG